MTKHHRSAGFLLLLATATCGAEIHKWVDSDGKVHYGDKPPAAARTTTITPEPAPRVTTPRPARTKTSPTSRLPKGLENHPLAIKAEEFRREVEARERMQAQESAAQKARRLARNEAAAKKSVARTRVYDQRRKDDAITTQSIAPADRRRKGFDGALDAKRFLVAKTGYRTEPHELKRGVSACHPDPDKDCANMNLINADYRHEFITGMSFKSSQLVGARFSGSQISSKTAFRNADLRNADFRGATVFGADFTGANLAGANMIGLDCNHCRFDDANLSGAVITDAQLLESSFGGANLKSTDFRRGKSIALTKFTQADLQGANFSGARLAGADFTQANLDDANLDGARIEQSIFTAASTKGCIGCPKQ